MDGEATGRARRQYPEGRDVRGGGRAQHGLTVAEIEDWQERLVLGAENALRTRPKDDEALKDEQIKNLQRKIGELVLDIDILREATKGRPSDPTTSGE
jgi:hypothetical protein